MFAGPRQLTTNRLTADQPLCWWRVDLVRVLQAKHAVKGNTTWGVNGESGEIADMKVLEVWEPLSVKLQTYKTAMEVRRYLDFGIDQWSSG